MELQDKAGQFLSEMRDKLMNHELYPGGSIPSTTTGKSYPLKITWTESVVEVSLTVPCTDLDCTDQRFIKERGIDFSLDGQTIAVTVKKNCFGRRVDTPHYHSVKKAIESSHRKFERARRDPASLSKWSAKKLGLL
jgi:hypothetical protein